MNGKTGSFYGNPSEAVAPRFKKNLIKIIFKIIILKLESFLVDPIVNALEVTARIAILDESDRTKI